MGVSSQFENIKERRDSELNNGEIQQSRFNYSKKIDEHERLLKKIKGMQKDGVTNTTIYFQIREKYPGNKKELWYRILNCAKKNKRNRSIH